MGPDFALTGYMYGKLINATELDLIVSLDYTYISDPVILRPSWV